MRKQSPKRKLEILLAYYNAGLSVRETERVTRCSHRTLPDILYWFCELTEREIRSLASYYDFPAAPLVALYHQLAPRPKGGVQQGRVEILGVEVGDWKEEDTNVVRRFVTLSAKAVSGDVVLEPPMLSFPGEQQEDVILHYANLAPYSQVNQPSVLLGGGEEVRVDVACTEPLISPERAGLAKTSGEVHCALSRQPLDQAQSTGCLPAHPFCLAYPELAYSIPAFWLKPMHYAVKVTLPYDRRSAYAYLQISSPAQALKLYGQLTYK